VLIPKTQEDEPDRYAFREATVHDLPVIEALCKWWQKNSIVSELPTRYQWLYEIETWKTHPELRHTLSVIYYLIYFMPSTNP
jgi:hypothetical protein